MEILMIPLTSSQDVAEGMALVERGFMAFEAPEYAPEGIASFLDFIRPEAMEERILRGEIRVWGAWVEDALVGVIAMRPPCAVSLLFVEAQWHRRGIARHMLEYALINYRKDSAPVTVHSSPYAVEVYRKMGFVETDPEETVDGIRFVPMMRTN